MEMPKVMDCSVSKCAYNTQQACHAMAITIGEPHQEPVCDTYFESETHASARGSTAGVGACKSDDCQYNEDFECTASNIKVGMKGSNPDCLTYEKR